MCILIFKWGDKYHICIKYSKEAIKDQSISLCYACAWSLFYNLQSLSNIKLIEKYAEAIGIVLIPSNWSHAKTDNPIQLHYFL